MLAQQNAYRSLVYFSISHNINLPNKARTNPYIHDIPLSFCSRFLPHRQQLLEIPPFAGGSSGNNSRRGSSVSTQSFSLLPLPRVVVRDIEGSARLSPTRGALLSPIVLSLVFIHVVVLYRNEVR